MTSAAHLLPLLPLAASFVVAFITAVMIAHDAATRQATPAQSLPDAMELERLRKQEAAAARLAAELRRIINSQQSVHLPLGTLGSARYALANWDKTMREAQK
jgi:hypothetical protein